MKSCPKPSKQAKGKRKSKKTPRQLLILELSDLCRKITIWRDGCNCVLSDTDGARCNDVSQWGHVIPQGASGYLKHNLSNSFRQCGSHNTIHKYSQIVYLDWFRQTFGNRAFEMLKEASLKTYHQFSILDLRELRDSYKELLQNTAVMSLSSFEDKVEAGYYGNIIRDAWIKDARI